MVHSWFNGMECDRLCFHLPDMEPRLGGRGREGGGGTERVVERGEVSELVSIVVVWIHN